MMIMNQALQDLVGRLVEVTSLGADVRYVDTGTLEAFDHPWLRLRKEGGEVLCFPVYNVRLVKAMDGQG